MGHRYPPPGILCRYDFLSYQGQNYHQKKVCQKLVALSCFMALFVYGDGIQLKVGTYLTNYWSEHRLVACQWIQNEVNKQKNIVSILSGMKIFKKKSKNCKHIVRVSSFFASLAAFCCQRNYLLEILPIHCIQTLPRLFYFILKRTKLQSDK